MSNDNSKKSWSGLKAKGYYIALGLCAVAIGIAGLVYYQTGNDTPSVQEDTTPIYAVAKDPQQDAISAIGTTPPTEGSTSPTQAESQPLKTMWPVEGEVCAVFAADKLTYNETTRDWRVHHGIDLAAAGGTEVKAAADGTVRAVSTDPVMGTTVVIDHAGGYVTTYSSLGEAVPVTAGQTVTMGQVIGTVGQSALTEKALEPHVHFSVTCHGALMDPAEFISGN